MSQPKLTPDFEKFDFSALNSLKNESKRKSITGMDTNGLRKYYSQSDAYERFKAIDAKGVIIQEIDKNDHFIMVKEYLSPYLAIEKRFYPNGNIQSKTISSWLGFSVGYYFEYNENGDLVRTIDNDAGYSFDFDQVMKFCNAHHIVLKERSEDGHHVSVGKVKNDSGRAVWSINVPGSGAGEVEYVVLDGETGKVLKSGKYVKALYP